VWGFMCEPVSKPNEAAVCAAMVEGARAALAGYPTTIEADLALLRGGEVAAGSRQELGIKVGGGVPSCRGGGGV
jgi:[ribulose-bisphosphate carboxylase]-lysine N-methyltransferase